MKLEDLPKKNIYQVPDRYFDQLPGKVMARVTTGTSESNPWFSFNFWRQPVLRGALAGLALVLSFVIIYIFAGNKAEQTTTLAEISDKEALEYLLASGQVDAHDISLMPHDNQDLTHEFIQVSDAEIIREIAKEDLSDVYFY